MAFKRLCALDESGNPCRSRNLTQEQIKELLRYDPITGVFTWATRVAVGRGEGSLAGGPHRGGYWRILIQGKRFSAHRLAWVYVHGRWPDHQIDHIDGNKSNNAISNLREATASQNRQNVGAYKSNKLGLRGVSKGKNNRYRAVIQIGGKNRHLGFFDTPEEAYAVYCTAALVNFGEFARIS